MYPQVHGVAKGQPLVGYVHTVWMKPLTVQDRAKRGEGSHGPRPALPMLPRSSTALQRIRELQIEPNLPDHDTGVFVHIYSWPLSNTGGRSKKKLPTQLKIHVSLCPSQNLPTNHLLFTRSLTNDINSQLIPIVYVVCINTLHPYNKVSR